MTGKGQNFHLKNTRFKTDSVRTDIYRQQVIVLIETKVLDHLFEEQDGRRRVKKSGGGAFSVCTAGYNVEDVQQGRDIKSAPQTISTERSLNSSRIKSGE